MFVQKLTVKQNQLDYKSKSFDFMLHMHEKRIRQKSYGNVETVRIFREDLLLHRHTHGLQSFYFTNKNLSFCTMNCQIRKFDSF